MNSRHVRIGFEMITVRCLTRCRCVSCARYQELVQHDLPYDLGDNRRYNGAGGIQPYISYVQDNVLMPDLRFSNPGERWRITARVLQVRVPTRIWSPPHQASFRLLPACLKVSGINGAHGQATEVKSFAGNSLKLPPLAQIPHVAAIDAGEVIVKGKSTLTWWGKIRMSSEVSLAELAYPIRWCGNRPL